MATTADQLLSSIKRRLGADPSPNLSDADLLAMADEEIVGNLYPLILQSQSDYYLSTLDHSITSGQNKYRLPNRSYGPIKDVLYVDDNDRESSLPIINVEEIGHLHDSHTSTCGYYAYADGDFLGLFPEPTTTRGTLRIRYYRHPNTLCLTSAARQILGVNSGTGTATVSSADSLWTTLSYLDVISAGNAHHVLLDRADITNIQTSLGISTITINPSLVGTSASTGDWFASTGTTPLVQLPDHMVPLLASRVVIQAANALGDQGAFARTAAMSKELEGRAQSALSPRLEAEPMIIVPRHSALRTGRGRRCR